MFARAFEDNQSRIDRRIRELLDEIARRVGAKSQYKEIGDAILAEISSVAEAGRVHSYQRWSADLGKYLDLFRWEAGNGPQPNQGLGADARESGEEVASIGSNAAGGFTPAGLSRRTHTFLLFGIMSAEDAVGSEVAFQDLIEEICDRFRNDKNARLLDESGAPRVRSWSVFSLRRWT